MTPNWVYNSFKKNIFSFFIIMLSHNIMFADTSQADRSEPWITIFVHGIISIKPHLTFANFVRLMQDRVANSVYARTVELMRKDPYFHQHHATQGLGLQKIDMDTIRPGASATAFARIYDTISSLNAPESTKNIYYTYGWSGLLSSKIRIIEAKMFLEALQRELAWYHNHNIYPKVRIISYSHGGNLTLKLGHFYMDSLPDLYIDELILIGVPIIKETDRLICSPLFKKVYHFYSLGDHIQWLDMFSSSQFFSSRTFRAYHNFCIPDKLTQVELRFRRLLQPAFYCTNNCTCRSNYSNHHSRHHVRISKPGHFELWSFGWTPANYRHSMPTYPFPVAIFLSYFVNCIKQHQELSRCIVLDVHSFSDTMYLYNKEGSTCNPVCAPFISPDILHELKELAFQYKPLHYSLDEYQDRVGALMFRARKEKKAEWRRTFYKICPLCGRDHIKCARRSLILLANQVPQM